MFWPIILPFKIAFWLLVAIVVILTIFAPSLKWKRKKTFLISLTIGIIILIPSCTGIMFVVDSFRFGKFEYNSYSDVKDFRIERFLPTKAKRITIYKRDTGHHAKYNISDYDFHLYLNDLWSKYGKHSAIKRKDLPGEGLPVGKDDFNPEFSNSGWPPLKNAIKFHSPVEADGGGATYCFDSTAGVAYHRAGYW